MSILVIGGTGTVGSDVVRRLAGQRDGVSALTRSQDKAGGVPEGARGVVGDLEKPETRGAERRRPRRADHAASPPRAASTAFRPSCASRKAGVRRLVYVSIHDVEKCPEAPHFQSKIEIQDALRNSGISHVLVRPNNFFQNDHWFHEPLTEHGVYPQPIGNKGLNRVDTRDIAEAIVTAVTEDRHEGSYPLNGPEPLTGTQTAAVWSRHLGRPVRYAGNDLDAWEQQQLQWGLPAWLVADFKIMYRFFQEKDSGRPRRTWRSRRSSSDTRRGGSKTSPEKPPRRGRNGPDRDAPRKGDRRRVVVRFPAPERCPSGLRSTLGKRVCPKGTEGSNPSLSATEISS